MPSLVAWICAGATGGIVIDDTEPARVLVGELAADSASEITRSTHPSIACTNWLLMTSSGEDLLRLMISSIADSTMGCKFS